MGHGHDFKLSSRRPGRAGLSRKGTAIVARACRSEKRLLLFDDEDNLHKQGGGPPARLPGGAEVTRVALYPSPWVLWCSPRHPLARKKVLKWADLRRADLVTAGRDHETQVALMMRDLPPEQRVTPSQVVDNISTALGLAAANQCITLSPAYVAAVAKPLGLVMRRITDPEVMREMSLYLPALRATA